MVGSNARDQNAGVELAGIIDRSRFNSFQLRVVILLGLVILFDGFDVQVITYVAPILTGVLKIDRSMLGPVFSAALVGTMGGAFLFGPLADRFGPKKILVCCVLLFSLCTLATTTMSSITELLCWRFLGGLGHGTPSGHDLVVVAESDPAAGHVQAVRVEHEVHGALGPDRPVVGCVPAHQDFVVPELQFAAPVVNFGGQYPDSCDPGGRFGWWAQQGSNL